MSRDAVAAWFSFTEVFDGHHEAFDRWHGLDHMPEQFGIEGIVGARRWTADRGLAAAGTDAELAAAQQIHLYLLADPAREALAEMTVLAKELIAEDRWFDARRAALYAAFRVTGTWVSPAVPVRARVLPHRPDRGAHVVVLDADRAQQVAADLALVPGVAGAWSFEDIAREDLAPETPAAPPGTGVVVAWLDDEPSRLAPLLAAAVPSPVRYSRTLHPARAYLSE